MNANPIFCALDTTDADAALRLAGALKGVVGGIKLGLEFFVANGPEGVRQVAAGQPLFLDLKLHDIPNTVAGAVRAIVPLGVTMTTIHASGGAAMMKAAADAAAEAGPSRPSLLGVTILTSLDQELLPSIGFDGPVSDAVKRLAALAQQSGLMARSVRPTRWRACARNAGPSLSWWCPASARPVRPPTISAA